VPPAPPAAAVLEALVAAARDLALAESGALALVSGGACACVAPLLRHDTQVLRTLHTPHMETDDQLSMNWPTQASTPLTYGQMMEVLIE
jgi:hypothetical protein